MRSKKFLPSLSLIALAVLLLTVLSVGCGGGGGGGISSNGTRSQDITPEDPNENTNPNSNPNKNPSDDPNNNGGNNDPTTNPDNPGNNEYPVTTLNGGIWQTPSGSEASGTFSFNNNSFPGHDTHIQLKIKEATSNTCKFGLKIATDVDDVSYIEGTYMYLLDEDADLNASIASNGNNSWTITWEGDDESGTCKITLDSDNTATVTISGKTSQVRVDSEPLENTVVDFEVSGQLQKDEDE